MVFWNFYFYRDMWSAIIEFFVFLLKKDSEGMLGKSLNILFLMNFIKGKGNLCYYVNICNSNFIMFVNLWLRNNIIIVFIFF